MEGEWRFVNRHRDPADGEVAGLQVSRVSWFPDVPRPGGRRGSGHRRRCTRVRHSAWSADHGPSCSEAMGFSLAGSERLSPPPPRLSVLFCLTVLPKSQGMQRVLRVLLFIKGAFCCWYSDSPVRTSKEIHQFWGRDGVMGNCTTGCFHSHRFLKK